MAILYGTQSNGETLPVLVDQFGNLLAKGIEGQPGVNGQPGAKGEPGGEGPTGPKGDPGVGVPLPYGDEGSYLGIIDGEPKWNIPVAPGPEPPPPEPIVCTTLWDNYQLYSSANSPVDPPDPLTYLQELPTWNNPNAQSYEGASKKFPDPTYGASIEDVYQLSGSYGKVLTVQYEVYFIAREGAYYDPISPSANSEYAQLITNDFKGDNASGGDSKWLGGTAIWLLNRELSSLTVTMTSSPRQTSNLQFFIRYFALEDAGVFALNRQVDFEQRLRALYGVTPDIDL